MAHDPRAPRALIAFDGHSAGGFPEIAQFDEIRVLLYRERPGPQPAGMVISLDQWRRLREQYQPPQWPDGERPYLFTGPDGLDELAPDASAVRFLPIPWPPIEALPKDLFSYSVAGLCLHNGGYADDFEEFVALCRQAGTIPIGITDSYYYPRNQVVPEVDGLRRCFSEELPDVLAEYL